MKKAIQFEYEILNAFLLFSGYKGKVLPKWVKEVVVLVRYPTAKEGKDTKSQI